MESNWGDYFRRQCMEVSWQVLKATLTNWAIRCKMKYKTEFKKKRKSTNEEGTSNTYRRSNCKAGSAWKISNESQKLLNFSYVVITLIVDVDSSASRKIQSSWLRSWHRKSHQVSTGKILWQSWFSRTESNIHWRS